MRAAKTPLVSILMPVYNQEQYLSESIESILSQSFTDFEFIIINDACTDSSPVIMDKYADLDNRIKIIKNTNNLGLTKSLNIALKEAKGKYLARQDGDDISYSNRLQKQFDFLEENTDVALVGIKYISININTGKRNCRDLPLKSEDMLNWIENAMVPMTMVMGRKDIFLEVGGYNEKIKYAQDYALYHAVSRKYQLANISEPMAEISFHDENITVNKRDEQRGYILYVLENASSEMSFDEFYPECLNRAKKRQAFQDEIIAFFDTKEYSKCFDLFNRYKDKYPIERVPRAYYAVASLLKLIDNPEAAIDIFISLSVLKYADTSIISGSLFHLGEISLKQDDLTKAVSYFEKCLQQNKNHKKAKENIDKIKEKV